MIRFGSVILCLLVCAGHADGCGLLGKFAAKRAARARERGLQEDPVFGTPAVANSKAEDWQHRRQVSINDKKSVEYFPIRADFFVEGEIPRHSITEADGVAFGKKGTVWEAVDEQGQRVGSYFSPRLLAETQVPQLFRDWLQKLKDSGKEVALVRFHTPFTSQGKLAISRQATRFKAEMERVFPKVPLAGVISFYDGNHTAWFSPAGLRVPTSSLRADQLWIPGWFDAAEVVKKTENAVTLTLKMPDTELETLGWLTSERSLWLKRPVVYLNFFFPNPQKVEKVALSDRQSERMRLLYPRVTTGPLVVKDNVTGATATVNALNRWNVAGQVEWDPKEKRFNLWDLSLDLGVDVTKSSQVEDLDLMFGRVEP